MSIKVHWNGKKFWVKVGTRKHYEDTSQGMIKFLEESSATKWDWTFMAKGQIKKEK